MGLTSYWPWQNKFKTRIAEMSDALGKVFYNRPTTDCSTDLLSGKNSKPQNLNNTIHAMTSNTWCSSKFWTLFFNHWKKRFDTWLDLAPFRLNMKSNQKYSFSNKSSFYFHTAQKWNCWFSDIRGCENCFSILTKRHSKQLTIEWVERLKNFIGHKICYSKYSHCDEMQISCR